MSWITERFRIPDPKHLRITHTDPRWNGFPTEKVANIFIPIPDLRRPCWVNGERAVFHCWANTARPALPHGVDPAEHPGHFQLAHLHAVVEYEDGTVARVWPQDMKFADGGRFEDFTWAPQEEDETDGGNQN